MEKKAEVIGLSLGTRAATRTQRGFSASKAVAQRTSPRIEIGYFISFVVVVQDFRVGVPRAASGFWGQ
jgi:hypothetical protein